MSKLFDVEPVISTYKSNEWYTRPVYIEAVRSVLGEIDLDPASCLAANQTVRAARIYTKEQDGLQQPWYGSVFLNPPYSRDNTLRGMESGDRPKSIMQMWIDKLLKEYQCGNVVSAILLTKADPKQNWFQPLWDYLICFAKDRVYFNRSGGLEPEKMMFGTAFVYLGSDTERFVEVFSKFGRVVQAIDSPLGEPVTLDLWSNEGIASP